LAKKLQMCEGKNTKYGTIKVVFCIESMKRTQYMIHQSTRKVVVEEGKRDVASPANATGKGQRENKQRNMPLEGTTKGFGHTMRKGKRKGARQTIAIFFII
jgi:hypothetical protein